MDLPSNIDAERLVLGAALCETDGYLRVASALSPDDFALNKHRVMFHRMRDLHERGATIDRVTLTDELLKMGQLESVDGLDYIVSLDDGLPELFNLEGYAEIVKEKAQLRRLMFLGQSLIDRAAMNQEQSTEILASVEEQLLDLGGEKVDQAFHTPLQIIEGYEGGFSAFLDPSKRPKGLLTGYIKLDEATGGLQAGDLIILGARPSMGKTAFALNVAHNVVKEPALAVPVALFALEMSKESLLLRLICAGARVDLQRFRHGYLNAEERRRLSMTATELASSPLYIDDSAGLSLIDIHAKLRRLEAEHTKPGLVIIDYLQLMRGDRKYENRNQEVSALSRGLKLLAREMGVPFLVLSQLSRAPEKRGDNRPQLSDLRDSGSLEQDADLVFFLHREEYYKRDREDLKGLADLIIGKQRNGPIGSHQLAFLRQFTRFENLAADLGPPESAGDEGEPI